MPSTPESEETEQPLCVDLGLGVYADDRCVDPHRCQFWGYCLNAPETADDA